MTRVSSNITLTDNRDKVDRAMFYANKAATRKAGGLISKETKAHVPVRLGATKKSVHTKTWAPKSKGRVAKGENRDAVRTEVGYWGAQTSRNKGRPVSFAKASWVENGTKPHEIKVGKKGNRKKLLSNGTTKFGRRFWHPGTKGKKPLQDAARAKAPEVANCAKEYYKQLSMLYGKEEEFFAKIAAEAGGDGDVEDGD